MDDRGHIIANQLIFHYSQLSVDVRNIVSYRPFTAETRVRVP